LEGMYVFYFDIMLLYPRMDHLPTCPDFSAYILVLGSIRVISVLDQQRTGVNVVGWLWLVRRVSKKNRVEGNSNASPRRIEWKVTVPVAPIKWCFTKVDVSAGNSPNMLKNLEGMYVFYFDIMLLYPRMDHLSTCPDSARTYWCWVVSAWSQYSTSNGLALMWLDDFDLSVASPRRIEWKVTVTRLQEESSGR
jgi:hypothetical protein